MTKVFVGAFGATPEQLQKKEPGAPPSKASLDLVDKWIQVMEAIALFHEVREYKRHPPDDDE